MSSWTWIFAGAFHESSRKRVIAFSVRNAMALATLMMPSKSTATTEIIMYRHSGNLIALISVAIILSWAMMESFTKNIIIMISLDWSTWSFSSFSSSSCIICKY